MGAQIVSLLSSGLGGGGSLPPKVILVAADFPTTIEANAHLGRVYIIGANVTDNDPTKTNTGQSFISGEEIIWDGVSAYFKLGADAIWIDNGTDISTVNPRNIDLLNNGLKDTFATTAVKLADSLNTSYNTANKTIIGSVNEILSKIPDENRIFYVRDGGNDSNSGKTIGTALATAEAANTKVAALVPVTSNINPAMIHVTDATLLSIGTYNPTNWTILYAPGAELRIDSYVCPSSFSEIVCRKYTGTATYPADGITINSGGHVITASEGVDFVVSNGVGGSGGDLYVNSPYISGEPPFQFLSTGAPINITLDVVDVFWDAEFPGLFIDTDQAVRINGIIEGRVINNTGGTPAPMIRSTGAAKINLLINNTDVAGKLYEISGTTEGYIKTFGKFDEGITSTVSGSATLNVVTKDAQLVTKANLDTAILWEDEIEDLIPKNVRNIRVQEDQSFFIGEDVSTLDQQQTGGSNQSGNSDLWQSVTAGLTGNLVRVDIFFQQIPPADTVVRIYAGEGTSGALLSTVPATQYIIGWNAITLPTPPYITSTTVFTIRATASGSLWWFFNLAGGYAGGRFSTSPTADGRFKTYVIQTLYAAWKEGVAVVGDFKLIAQNNSGTSTTKIYNSAVGQVTELELNEGATKINEFSDDITMAGDSSTAFVTEHSAKTYTDNLIPSSELEEFTATAGQTSFTITGAAPLSPTTTKFAVQGQLRQYGVTKDYTISGNTLTWYNNDYTMQNGDLGQLWYNDAANSLSPSTERIVSKGFGDTPYSANAGEVVLVDTSGGAVSVVLPSATANPGARIRISKVTSDSNVVTINTTGGDTVGFQASWSLSHQGDSTTGISDGGTEWCLITERHATGFIYFLPDHDANQGSHRVQNILTSGDSNFEFKIPDDFLSIIELKIELTPSAGAAGANKNIDLSSDYGKPGETYNNHSESDIATLYNFTGLTDTFTSIDLSSVFTAIEANDICGVNIDHTVVGGTISYYGISLTYRKKG